MSDLLEDIITHLHNNDLCGALAEGAFIDKLPDTPDECLALFEYEGMGDVPWETDAAHRSIQLVCRATSASKAKANAWSIYDFIKQSLDEIGRVDFNGRFTQTTIRQTPFKFDEDSKARVVYGFNLGVTTTNNM